MAKRIICPKCKYVGLPGKKKRGSGRVEMMGWMVFPLGIPYTLWRMIAKMKVCKSCSHPILIDEKSLVGQKMLEKMYGLDSSVERREKSTTLKPPLDIAKPDNDLTPLPEKLAVRRDKSIKRPEDDPEQF